MFVWVKGCMPHVKKWENDLLAQWCNRYKNGKKDGSSIQLSVEPINLYTIRFPEEELDRVLGLVGQTDYLYKRYKPIRTVTKWIQKFMKLEPVPEPSKLTPQMQPHPVFKAVAVTAIGLKKEKFRDDGTEML